jgi:hypothetical protein
MSDFSILPEFAEGSIGTVADRAEIRTAPIQRPAIFYALGRNVNRRSIFGQKYSFALYLP